MVNDALDTLGKKLEGGENRDAIHLAVVPAEAKHALRPGEHVGLVDGVASAKGGEFVGIVDPFIDGYVDAGESFWLIVYPRTITSLRHEWTHPQIDRNPGGGKKCSKEYSEQWLRDFIEKSDLPDYETVISVARANKGKWADEYLIFNDVDAHGEIPDEFWDHLEVITGEKFEDRAQYFSCSC